MGGVVAEGEDSFSLFCASILSYLIQKLLRMGIKLIKECDEMKLAAMLTNHPSLKTTS